MCFLTSCGGVGVGVDNMPYKKAVMFREQFITKGVPPKRHSPKMLRLAFRGTK